MEVTSTSLLQILVWIKMLLAKFLLDGVGQALADGALSFRDTVKSFVLCVQLLHKPAFG